MTDTASNNDNIEAREILDLNSIGPTDFLGDIVLVDKASHVRVLSLCLQNQVKHVVQKTSLRSNDEIGFSTKVRQSPAHFFEHPLSCIMGQNDPSAQSESQLMKVSAAISSVDEIEPTSEVFADFVRGLSASPALLTDVLTFIDEGLSNAIYGAPSASSPDPNPTDRSQVQIDPSRKPFLFAGHDNERVIVGCRDSYGSLNTQALVNRIKRCYESDISSIINFGEGGAGIGSFMMFNSCASMYIAVDPGVSTTVCCSFPFKLSATARGEMPKNIHLIQR